MRIWLLVDQLKSHNIAVIDQILKNSPRTLKSGHSILVTQIDRTHREFSVDRSFCILKRGYDLPNSQIEEGNFPVIASTTINAFHKYYKANPPVITTGRSGSLGKVLFDNRKAWPLNTSLYVKDFKENNPYLIYYTLKNMNLESFNSGAGVPTLNRNHLGALKLHVPDVAIQTKFNSQVDPVFKQCDVLNSEIDALNMTKTQLLPRLISGKFSVENSNIQFPPSMQAEEQV